MSQTHCHLPHTTSNDAQCYPSHNFCSITTGWLLQTFQKCFWMLPCIWGRVGAGACHPQHQQQQCAHIPGRCGVGNQEGEASCGVMPTPTSWFNDAKPASLVDCFIIFHVASGDPILSLHTLYLPGWLFYFLDTILFILHWWCTLPPNAALGCHHVPPDATGGQDCFYTLCHAHRLIV